MHNIGFSKVISPALNGFSKGFLAMTFTHTLTSKLKCAVFQTWREGEGGSFTGLVFRER